MKRLIFLNWRWTCPKEELDTFNNPQGNTEDKKIIISAFEKEDLIEHLKNNILNQNNESQYLILTHNTPGNFCSVSKPDILSGLENKDSIKVFEFSGGSDYVYYGDDNTDGLFEEDEEKADLVFANFDKVWNHYWNELEIEYQKKNLINTFIPLAIDMEGLINAPNDEVRNEYYNKILDSINVNGDSIIKSWENIKKILALKLYDSSEHPKEYLSDDIKFIDKEKNDMYFCKLETSKKPGFTKEGIIGLFSDAKSENVNSIKDWINKVILIMDEKLNKDKNQNPNEN